MADKSKIEWTDATWNPVTGCSKVSPGCANCYAETMAMTRLTGRPGYPGLPWIPENAATNVVLRPERLGQPLRWREPRRVFVNSMSDLFHELVPDDYIRQVFEVMASVPRHSFQVLTKRPERMHELLRQEPLPVNVWVGTSIENDRWTDRADYLRGIPAAVRFISAEPLLGPLHSLDLEGIDWLIVGGESGRGHRPVRAEWVRDLRDRSIRDGVRFFFKQWGGMRPKTNGRELDGQTWDEYPDVLKERLLRIDSLNEPRHQSSVVVEHAETFLFGRAANRGELVPAE